MTDRPYRFLSGEALHRKRKAADVQLAHRIAWLRAHDEKFREVLDLGLALDDEVDARNNRR